MEIELTYRNIPGNSHFQWLAQEEHSLAVVSGAASGATHAIQSINASIASSEGSQYVTSFTLRCEVNDHAIKCIALEGIDPYLDMADPNVSLPPQFKYDRYFEYRFDGRNEWGKWTSLIGDDPIEISYPDNDELRRNHVGRLLNTVHSNFTNKFEFLIELRAMEDLEEVVDDESHDFKAYRYKSLSGANLYYLVSNDGAWEQFHEDSMNSPSLSLEWNFNHPVDRFPSSFTMHHRDFFAQYRVMRVSKIETDDSIFKVELKKQQTAEPNP